MKCLSENLRLLRPWLVKRKMICKSFGKSRKPRIDDQTWHKRHKETRTCLSRQCWPNTFINVHQLAIPSNFEFAIWNLSRCNRSDHRIAWVIEKNREKRLKQHSRMISYSRANQQSSNFMPSRSVFYRWFFGNCTDRALFINGAKSICFYTSQVRTCQLLQGLTGAIFDSLKLLFRKWCGPAWVLSL